MTGRAVVYSIIAVFFGQILLAFAIAMGAPNPEDSTAAAHLSASTNIRRDECPAIMAPRTIPVDPQLAAQATWLMFWCAGTEIGYDLEPAVNGGNVAYDLTPYRNRAEQLAAEAVTVAACESGYDPHHMVSNNPWGYGGVFAFGNPQIRAYGYLTVGGDVATELEAKANVHNSIYAATRLFIQDVDSRPPFYGWSAWAPVNTNYGGVNDKVKFPIIPRFASTQPGFVGRFSQQSLPPFALDPFTWRVPGRAICPPVVASNPMWSPTLPIPTSTPIGTPTTTVADALT